MPLRSPSAAQSPTSHAATAASLRIRGLALSDYQTNAYIAWEEGAAAGEARPCWIFDAPGETEQLIDAVKAEGLTPTALMLTHAHLDHIAGVHQLREAWPNLQIAVHEAERDWLTDPHLNMSAFTGYPVTAPPATRILKHGETVTLGSIAWNVIHVPGHSPGSVAFYAPSAGVVIGGDTLMKDGMGRTDLRGGSLRQLVDSIKDVLLALPDETKLLSGHGPTTTIGRERASNRMIRDAERMVARGED